MLFGCADAAKGYTAAPQATARNSRRLMGHYSKLRLGVTFILARRGADVPFGSKADICSAKRHVRFTPNSDRESGPPQNAMCARLNKSSNSKLIRDFKLHFPNDISPIVHIVSQPNLRLLERVGGNHVEFLLLQSLNYRGCL